MSLSGASMSSGFSSLLFVVEKVPRNGMPQL